jgi:hypothetical protein
MKHDPSPKIIRPFSDEIFAKLQNHVREVRSIYDWPGIPYHDLNASGNEKFNRWFWHNLPMLVHLHNSPEFIKAASELFGQPLKPSYVFLSMYGKEGVCPIHSDRPQCQFTIDLVVNMDAPWPIYVKDEPYVLEKEGDALAYSGTGQVHYRKPMTEDSKATYMDLVFFHFCPINWMGALS